jgi:hypothetical protein
MRPARLARLPEPTARVGQGIQFILFFWIPAYAGMTITENNTRPPAFSLCAIRYM